MTAPTPTPSAPETSPAETLPADRLRVDRMLEPVRKVLRIVGLIVLAVMIATPAFQVFMRQFLGMPMIGAEELSRFMLISVVMLAVPYTVSSGASVRMEELLQALPPRLQRLLLLLICILGSLAFAYAAVSVFTATVRNLNNETPTLGIPYFIFFSAAFVGFLLASAEYALQAYKVWRHLPLYVTFEAEQPVEEPQL